MSLIANFGAGILTSIHNFRINFNPPPRSTQYGMPFVSHWVMLGHMESTWKGWLYSDSRESCTMAQISQGFWGILTLEHGLGTH